jgi:hypothetical protein
MLWLSATDYLFHKFTNRYENVVETIRSMRYYPSGAPVFTPTQDADK